MNTVLIGVGIVVAILAAIVLLDRPYTPSIVDEKGVPLPNSITSMEEVEINGIKQFFLIRGADKDLPVLLVAHGGLGTPYSALGHTFQRDWEKHFIVVHWDQRGGGKLYKNADPSSVTEKQLLDDTHAVAKYLNERFGKKVYVMGHSWGSYLAYKTAADYPELFKAYIGVGQTVGILKEDEYSHTWVLEEAKRRGDKKAIADMEKLSPPPYDDVVEAYGLKYGLIDTYGGFFPKGGMFFMVKSVFTSPEYTLLDGFRYVKGMMNYEAALLKNEHDSMWNFSIEDITNIDIPVYFIYGENDQVTPGFVVEEYAKTLTAPSVTNIKVKSAAHFPFVDQKDEFTQLLVDRVLKETADN